jgi:hypothetical protein
MKLLLAAFQGAVFGLLWTRLVGDTELRGLWIGALGFPIIAIVLSRIYPRVAAAAGALLTLLWTGTCGYVALEDPWFGSPLWVAVFAVGGLLFGVLSNAVFFGPAGDGVASPRAAGARDRKSERAQRGSPSAPPRAAGEPDPWTVLGVEPTASPPEVARAFRARMAEYHPDKVATLGPEIRALADEKAKRITLGYSRVRNAPLGGVK